METNGTLDWFKEVSGVGMPRWGWAALVLVLVVEGALGRSKNPQLRSIASAIAALLKALLELSRFSRIPGLGPTLVRVLDALAPPAEKGPIPHTEMPTPGDGPKPPEPPKG